MYKVSYLKKSVFSSYLTNGDVIWILRQILYGKPFVVFLSR